MCVDLIEKMCYVRTVCQCIWLGFALFLFVLCNWCYCSKQVSRRTIVSIHCSFSFIAITAVEQWGSHNAFPSLSLYAVLLFHQKITSIAFENAVSCVICVLWFFLPSTSFSLLVLFVMLFLLFIYFVNVSIFFLPCH